MSHCARTLFLALALGLSPPALEAQSASGAQAPMIKRATRPLKPVTLDLSTGTIKRNQGVRQKGSPNFNTAVSLDNLDHSGFVAAGSGPGTPFGPCQWIDSANKGQGRTGGQSEILTSFTFAYCSAAADPGSGGPGGKVRIGFRAGYTGPVNGAPSGTQVASFNLSGMPAWTGCGSFFGGFACYLMQTDITHAPVVLPDGPIGWSWEFRDVGSDGVLAKTFPFLSCIQSCEGQGPDNTGGMTDFMDRYCPTGTLQSTFTFGTTTTGASYTSLSMQLREAEPVAAAVSTFGPGNPHTLVSGPAIYDGSSLTWTADLDCSGAAPGLSFVRFGIPPAPAPMPTKFGTVYVNVLPGQGFVLLEPHTGGSTAFAIHQPLAIELLGACCFAQGFCGDTPFGRLSNAASVTIGTF